MAGVYQLSDTADADSTDTSSEEDVQDQHFSTEHSHRHRGFRGGTRSHLVSTQSSEEGEGKGGTKKAADPGPFRYNKRVFITALPCLLLVLAMTGEMLVLVVSLGGLVIMLMTHMGQEANRKCVVVFSLLFIPCQILVVGTVLPLLWLSVWNLALVGLVNVFCILTGGWVILQFAAFRKEEPLLCMVIEEGLFALYPFVCCALVTWVLSTVLPVIFSPFIFLFLWFVYLQLYLMPGHSSFKKTDAGDEDLSIVQKPTVIAIVLVFIASGPAIHVVLTLAGTSPAAVFTVSFLAVLCELLCLGIFLFTLLSLRQLCDYMGLPHAVLVQARWASGGCIVLLAYPTLQHLGVVSHYLPSLPLAVVAFAAYGLILSLRKDKMLSILLMGGVMMLMCLWLYHLPWALKYDFLGMLPLRSLNVVVGVNFVLCVLAIFAAWHCSMEVFGALLLLQSAATTVCEMGLYGAGLYPPPTFQLTGVLATYMLYRLHAANKIARNTAAMACAIQLTKTTVGALGYLRTVGKGEEVIGDVKLMDFATLLCFVGVLVWLFVYEAKEEATLSEVVKDITMLMVSLATNSRSLLAPLGQVILQMDPSAADVLGLWFGAGGILVLLYTLHHGQVSGARQWLMKVAGMMGVTGALVVVIQPVFELSLWSLYQGGEIVSLLLIGALLIWRMELRLSQTVMAAGLLGLCPGLRTAWLLYGEETTVLHFVLVVVIACCLLAFLLILVHTHIASDTTHSFFKMGTVALAALLAAVLAVDIISLQPRSSLWNYPVWRLAFGVTVCVSVCLKALAEKLGPGNLPLTKETESRLPVLPILANMATVSAFLLARTQGPQDVLLHDLWCCACSVLLTLLQSDPVMFPSLSPTNRATPIIMASVASLVFSTLAQSRLWHCSGSGGVFVGVVELVMVLCSLPVYVVLFGVLWCGEVWSEKAVVFTMPLNAFVFLLASSYTAWALCVAGFVCGIGMMVYRLPLLPYQPDVFS